MMNNAADGSGSVCQTIEQVLQHSPAMCLRSGPNGEIYWANKSFEEWSRYTQHELTEMGWIELSQDDPNLQADLIAAQECVDGKRSSYTSLKRYVPKFGNPQLGQLAAVRYPEEGPLEWFLCFWIPLQEAKGEAFDIAMQHIDENTKQTQQVQEALVAILSQMKDHDEREFAMDDDSKLISAMVTWCKSHPRIALAMFGLIGGAFSLNQITDLLMRLSGVKKV